MSSRDGGAGGPRRAGETGEPALARALVSWLVEAGRVAEVRQDLREVYRGHARLHGRASARRRYWKEVAGLLRWRRPPGRRPRAGGLQRALAGLGQDLRLGLRTLLGRPAGTVVAVLTLGLGIGLSTAMFSVLEGVVLRPLRLPDPDTVVLLSQRTVERQRTFVSGPDFEAFRESLARAAEAGERRPLAELAAFQYQMPTMVTDGGARLVQAARVSPWFFRMLGVQPALGRDFALPEGGRIESGVAILGHELWQRQFGGDPEVVGRALELPPRRYTVIGVLPGGLDLPRGRELWMPLDLAAAPWMRDRSVQPFQLYGRLAPGVSLPAARDRLDEVARYLAAQYPETNEGLGADLEPLRHTVVGDVARPLTLLLGAVAVVLLVACLNVGALALAGGAARRQEMAMHRALGASRGRLLRRVLLEVALVAAVGGAAGLGAAHSGVGLVRALVPASLPRLDGLGVNGAVAGFAVVATAVSALLAGLGPAWRAATSADRGAALLGATPGPADSRPGRCPRVSGLLVVEFALSAVLLVGAGLFFRSLHHLEAVDLGLEHRGVQTFRVSIPGGIDPVAATDRIRRELMTPPGSEVAITSHLPLTGQYLTAEFAIAGRALPRGPDRPRASFRLVSPGYFRIVGVPLRGGRPLRAEDAPPGRRVALVNETLARRHWPDGDPVGERLAFTVGETTPGPDDWIEIVGVVADVRHLGPSREPGPEIYVPHAQGGEGWDWVAGSVGFVLRSPGRPISEGRIRSVVARVDPTIPVYAFASLDDFLAATTADMRVAARLLEVFALLALVLAAVGIYGVVSFTVRSRTRDIGIRKALGAARGRIVAEVLLGSLRTVLLGGGIGLGASALLGRAVAHLLHGVTPLDAGTFSVVALLLLAAAGLAAYVPARRAAAVDPVRALRRGDG